MSSGRRPTTGSDTHGMRTIQLDQSDGFARDFSRMSIEEAVSSL